MSIKLNLVFVELRPFKSYPLRQLTKIRYSFRRFGAICTRSLGLSGAKRVGFASNGNALLRLNSTTTLGSAGSIIQLPPDNVICREVELYGEWDITESQFLSDGLLEMHRKKSSKYAYLDIGANAGLIARQTLLLSGTQANLVLVEPIPLHVSAMTANL